jgi:hypothetical protein
MNLLPERYPLRSRETSKSIGQYMLGRMIQSIYGKQATILEEFPVPEERLFLDFYLPHHKLAFEYQGIQHDQFNKFFHVNKQGFERSQARDSRKLDWCNINDISLIAVRGNPSIEDLQNMIKEARS